MSESADSGERCSGQVAKYLTKQAGRVRRRVLKAGSAFPSNRVDLVRLIVSTSSDREATAHKCAAACSSFASPVAVEIPAQYVCGNVLFGSGDGFVWEYFGQRFVITSATVRISRKVRRDVRKADLEVRFDQDFEQIVAECASRQGTWLTEGLSELYVELYRAGSAACIGTYRDNELVGGLFGLVVGRVFHGMSMFHLTSSAGTSALAACVAQLGTDKRWDMIDTGVGKQSFERFGVTEVALASVQSQVLEAIGRPQNPDQLLSDDDPAAATPASP